MKITEIITEASKIPSSQVSATPGMRKHVSLDNSSPYAPWRFAAHFLGGAGAPDGKYEHEPEKEGPSGQSFVTAAYSSGDQAILDQAERAFGVSSQRMTPNGSTEDSDIHKISPHRQVGDIALRPRKSRKRT
jgi:hypothetical protein